MDITDAVDAAQSLVEERFPEAVAAFLGGSLARGEGTDTSDLDVVVIRPAPAEVYRETVVWHGRPAEVFVHTPESVRTMFAWDRANGVPTMASLCADSLVLRSVDGTAEQVARWARDTLRSGPRPIGPEALAFRRYTVTDLRDDLLDCEDQDERLAVAALLHVQAAELLLAVAGAWRGKGKWLPRRLRAATPELGNRLLADYRTVTAGGPAEPLGTTVTAILDLAGGPLLAGDRRTAGPSLLAGPAD